MENNSIHFKRCQPRQRGADKGICSKLAGIPDGLKIDKNGNVYSGCGDGLNVWAANGDLIGKIIVEGGVANFLFADNDLVMLAETRVLKLHLLCKGDCNEI